MGEKRVKELLTEYQDMKTIAKLKPEQIQEDLGFPKLIAEAIVELANKNK
jgi:excinuclease UvrABC nuclease subunit